MKVTSRFGAFAIHLLISLIILTVLLAVLVLWWFPNGLIYAGGLEGLKILLGVDLVLGPLLTLVVYKHGKKSLKFDLSVIAFLQLSCLVVGVWLIFTQRPVVQTLSDDAVHIISAADAKENKLDWRSLKGSTPKLVFSDIPKGDDVKERFAFKFTTSIDTSIPFESDAKFYKNFSDVDEQEFTERLEHIKESAGESKVSKDENDDCYWMPIKSSHATGQACFRRNEGVIKLSNKRFFGTSSE